MKRSEFLRNSGLLAAGVLLNDKLSFAGGRGEWPEVRTPLDKRKFHSPAIEAAIAEFKKKCKRS